jgi:AraC-like DNA-binding protein/mannose-6-phosphate isomerase-like protein (cupin superfamily)
MNISLVHWMVVELEYGKNNIRFIKKEDLEIVEGSSSHSFPIHTHQVFCVGIVTKGSLKFIIDGKEHCLGNNSIYLVPPHKSHTIIPIDHNHYNYLAICIRNLFPQTNLITYTCEDITIAKEIIQIYDNFKQTKDVCFLKERMSSILSSMFTVDNRITVNKPNDLIDKAANLITDSLDKPFDLEALATEVHISKFYLSRIFKKQFGVTPLQFYTQAKVKKVRQELLKEQQPALLAYDLGFVDQSHLCNTFKKYLGVSPLQFKNNYSNV